MYSPVSLNKSSDTLEPDDSEPVSYKYQEQAYRGTECEEELCEWLSDTTEPKKWISVGDFLPYGSRFFYQDTTKVLRVKDLGVKRRILILGVIGSFTPFCWNRHLFRVLRKLRYYEERGIEYICCISTNDIYTHRAWSEYLGCADSVIMLSDSNAVFTRQIGMDMVVPWLDNKIRSKRYVIYAEDMQVSKMIVAPDNKSDFTWECEHLQHEEKFNEEEDSDSDAWI